MKKLTQKVSITVLCLVMIVLSAVPAFAGSIVLVEDHSVVDCVHYYQEDGIFYYLIKCPKGELDKITLALTGSPEGGGIGSVSLKQGVTGIFELGYAYSDDNYDYTWFVAKCSEYPNNIYSSHGGLGIKIFYFDGENSKMATNTSNGSTTSGPGYWLSA